MGSIEFEGWKVQLANINTLNNAREVSRLGLVFEQEGDLTHARAKGNVAAYYVILQEVRSQLVSGGFIVKVELSTGEKREINLGTGWVTENGKDISQLFT